MKKRVISIVAGVVMLTGLVGGVAFAGNGGADPARCGTPFEAPGQVCPPS